MCLAPSPSRLDGSLGSFPIDVPVVINPQASVLSGKFAVLIRDGFSSTVRRATQEGRESFEVAQQSCRRKDARSSGVNFPDSALGLLEEAPKIIREGGNLSDAAALDLPDQFQPDPVSHGSACTLRTIPRFTQRVYSHRSTRLSFPSAGRSRRKIWFIVLNRSWSVNSQTTRLSRVTSKACGCLPRKSPGR